MKTSRRAFLAGLAAASAGAAQAQLTDAADDAPQAQERLVETKPAAPVRQTEVVIVGGGLAGLTAARRLVQGGVDAVVLEARDRVGGRTLSHEYAPGCIAELGGTWVGPTQDRVLALVQELGLNLFDQFLAGDTVYVSRGDVTRFSDHPPLGAIPPAPLLIPDLAMTKLFIDGAVKDIPVGQPWLSPRAAELDRQTFEGWLRSRTMNLRHETEKNFSSAFEALFGAEAGEMSALFVLHYVACAGNDSTVGNFERLVNTRAGAQERKIVEGAQSLSTRMAKDLGSRVVLNAPVRRIEQGADGVTVYADGTLVRGDRVIVAVPPALAGRIQYTPLLPPARDQLTQRYGMGWLIKCEAIYETPFWRENGLNGSAVVLDGPARSIFDVSPPDGRRGGLLGFVGGQGARELAGKPEALRAAVLENFAQCFGEKARQPQEWFVQDWGQEEWSRGCPTGIAPPGVLTAFGPALTQPAGRIHWSGTETAGYWTGYMDGAVRSGERAAKEILAIVRPPLDKSNKAVQANTERFA